MKGLQIKGRDGLGLVYQCVGVSITLMMREVGGEEGGGTEKITQLRVS